MGGIIGAVSGKLVLGTAALLFAAKVDQRSILAAIDGDAATSAISERLADRLHAASSTADGSASGRSARVWLGLDGGTFKVTLPVATNGVADRADLRIGQDILAAHFIRLDFRRRTSRLVLRDRLASETRALIAIPIDTAPDGTILVPVQMNDGTKAQARLQFNFHAEGNEAQTRQSQTPIAILGEGDGKVFEIDDYHVDDGARASKVFIDLLAFSNQVILLDLPHKRLWVSGRGSRT